MKPKLSIVTITYEDAKGLSQTLGSLALLKSSGFSFEHIVVDSSPELNTPLFEKLNDWPLVRIETPPKGIYPAFNLGIEHARGDFIWFLNGGDRLKSLTNLQRALQHFEGMFDTDLFCAGVDLFRDEHYTYSAIPKDPLISNLLGQNTLCHQGVIYRRSLFDRIGNFSTEYKLAGDYEHHFRCYFAKVKAHFSKLILAEFDRDGRSDNFKPVFKEFRKIWKKYRSQFETTVALRNEALGLINYAGIALMKMPLPAPITSPLKSLWYKLLRQ